MRLAILVLFLLAPAARFPARAGPPAVSAEEYRERRGRALDGLKEKDDRRRAVLLLRAPRPDRFAGDVDYLYRPENDLYYLTGLAEPGITLLLASEDVEGLGRELLFLERADPALRLWVGQRLDAERAAQVSGLPRAAILDPGEVRTRLRLALGAGSGRRGHGSERGPRPRLFFEGPPFAGGEPPSEPYGFLLAALGSAAFHLELERPGRLLHPMRQVKSPAELALLQKAIDATCKAHRKVLRAARPGMYEYELRAVIEGTFIAEGCSGWAFPSIIGSGPNSCILHYQAYDRRTKPGDLVVIDIGAEYSFYAADVSRTIPISGRFTSRQREIYEIVLEAQKAAIALVRPGLPWGEVNATARRKVAEGLERLGMIASESEVRKYLPHGVSHGLGLDVHDPMPIAELRPGMVITVEPGIYIPEEELGVRIEDDVLVTADGHEVLSKDAPKEVEEIERWMSQQRF
jgi:Xaa-Pro aminopeptidase